MEKAVILAGGLGTRMQKEDPEARLTGQQAAMAASGIKALISVGRPFLDYVLSALADAGYGRVCLVVGPDHDAMREYYGSLDCRRLHIEFAVQPKPLGTGNAVSAAERFAGDDPFLVINADNYYPVEALRALRGLDGCGTVAFEREGLVAGGNIPAERVKRYALLQVNECGDLTGIVEKPSDEFVLQQPAPILVSMNCWRFDARIFPACRAISPSERGELEITDAVQYAIDRLGVRFCALNVSAGVLDLSSRSDIAEVKKRLVGTEVHL